MLPLGEQANMAVSMPDTAATTCVFDGLHAYPECAGKEAGFVACQPFLSVHAPLHMSRSRFASTVPLSTKVLFSNRRFQIRTMLSPLPGEAFPEATSMIYSSDDESGETQPLITWPAMPHAQVVPGQPPRFNVPRQEPAQEESTSTTSASNAASFVSVFRAWSVNHSAEMEEM